MWVYCYPIILVECKMVDLVGFQGMEEQSCLWVRQLQAPNIERLVLDTVVLAAVAAAKSSLWSLLCTHLRAVWHRVIPPIIWGKCNLTVEAWLLSGHLTEARCVCRVGDRSLEKTLILRWLRHTWLRVSGCSSRKFGMYGDDLKGKGKGKKRQKERKLRDGNFHLSLGTFFL